MPASLMLRYGHHHWSDAMTIRLIIASVMMCVSTVTYAANKHVLTVYTYDSFTSEWGPGPAIEIAFERQCNCDLQFVGLDSSLGILSRVQIEGENSKADIVLGLDTNLTEVARKTGLFAPHGSARKANALPVPFEDDIFMPFDWSAFAFIYDTERMATPPASFAELLALPEDVKIAIQDPRTSTPGLGLMLWMKSLYGDDAPAAWAELNPKILTVTKSWWDAYSLFLEGEADMVLSYTTSPAYHVIAEGKTNYAAAEFSEGHYLQIEVAAMLKNASEPVLAAEFMDFIQTADFQSVIPTTNWMYPVSKAAVPAEFADLIQPERHYLFEGAEVAANQKAWVAEWLEASTQ